MLSGTNLYGSGVLHYCATWKTPPHGFLKLNVDGAFTSQIGGGCGGILRDEFGHFVTGFQHRLPDGNSLTAEIWAILIGLKTCWNWGVRKLLVESDAAEAIRMVKENISFMYLHQNLISEIRELLTRQWEVELLGISRTVNNVADSLAKSALSLAPGFYNILVPSNELNLLLQMDCNKPRDLG